MNRLGGKIILWGIVLGMLVFTAIRTLHFLMQTFPPDQQYVAFLALVAFDIGVLAWFYFATNSAEGAAQRTVAYGMIFVCAVGVIITTIGDMINVSAQNHLTTTPGWWFTAALWGVIIVVVLNVIAGIVVHLVDPKHQRHLAQEQARDSIHKATLASIQQRAGEVAPRIAEQVAKAWEDQVIQEMTGHLPVRVTEEPSRPPALPPARTVEGQVVSESSSRRPLLQRPRFLRREESASQPTAQAQPTETKSAAPQKATQAQPTEAKPVAPQQPSASEPPASTGQGTSETALDVAHAERLARLAKAAESKGYSLDRLESLLGLSSPNGNDPAKKNP
jgi:hypothetical protein